MRSSVFVLAAVLTLSFNFASNIAYGAEKPKGNAKQASPVVTVEQRASMANVHEKMATCLRSEKAMSECQGEMMKSCGETMGKNCPMMGQMDQMHRMMGKGSMHGKSMKHEHEHEHEKDQEQGEGQKN